MGGLLSVVDEQDGVGGRIEGLEDGGQNVGPHRAHHGHIETAGIEVAADVAAHEGKCGSVSFALPAVHDGAGEVSVV